MSAKYFSAFLAISAFCTIAIAAAATKPAGSPPAGMQQAIFAGGCFWSMEHVFDEIPGVQSVTVGYTGGSAKGPSCASRWASPSSAGSSPASC